MRRIVISKNCSSQQFRMGDFHKCREIYSRWDFHNQCELRRANETHNCKVHCKLFTICSHNVLCRLCMTCLCHMLHTWWECLSCHLHGCCSLCRAAMAPHGLRLCQGLKVLPRAVTKLRSCSNVHTCPKTQWCQQVYSQQQAGSSSV